MILAGDYLRNPKPLRESFMKLRCFLVRQRASRAMAWSGYLRISQNQKHLFGRIIRIIVLGALYCVPLSMDIPIWHVDKSLCNLRLKVWVSALLLKKPGPCHHQGTSKSSKSAFCVPDGKGKSHLTKNSDMFLGGCLNCS